jgi:hypothetical protein
LMPLRAKWLTTYGHCPLIKRCYLLSNFQQLNGGAV